MPDYSVGVIGLGHMGSLHAKTFDDIAKCELRALTDTDRKRAESVAAELKIGYNKVYDTHKEMLACEELDLISVATPLGLHTDIVVDCILDRQINAVHCEKPMAASWNGCRQMVHEAEEANTQLTFTHQSRFSEPVNVVKKLLDRGVIGSLQRIEISRRDLYESGIHQIDLCNYFVGDICIEWVLGAVDYHDREMVNGAHIEDQALSLWEYENGVHGLACTGHGTDAVGANQRLLGSNGIIEIEFWTEEPVRILRYGEQWERYTCSEDDPLQTAFEHVIKCLDTAEDPRISGENALNGAEIAFATWESVRQRRRIDLPLQIDDNPLRSMIASDEISPD